MAREQEAERRVHARRLVEHEAECRLGGSVLTGIVRNEGPGGVFFAMNGNGRPLEDETPGLRYEPAIGDLVLLAFAKKDERPPLLATVRWHGYSTHHGCLGMGLQFDEL